MPDRRPLFYTFANHMHWVDMQWLWGYHVLPGSIRDMLRLVDESGARGNVNFDAVGYERLAAEAPESLAALRAAIAGGLVEPVGGTYGQPYGLFHGGESNVRQLALGVRATRRLLGVRPTGFWEEEFYFFPQLPQLLAAAGYTGASLFFQWTWHTPELPREPGALVLWEGADGTRLPTLPRNDLNLHQWPEDFDGLLDRLAAERGRGTEQGPPAIAQWVELMPSQDWMCRSELLLPRLYELFNDPRFEVRSRTLTTLLAELSRETSPPVRRYTMDDVWHGMTLGKNADRHPRASAESERGILAAESLSALAGVFGRPYASWDVYPTWELDEAWRNALAAQHHDNHECEGLCGFIGHQQFDTARSMSREVLGRVHALLRARARGGDVVHNALGWARTVRRRGPGLAGLEEAAIPAFGYTTRGYQPLAVGHGVRCTRSRGVVALTRGDFRVEIDARTGGVVRIRRGKEEVLGAGGSLLRPCVLGPGGRSRRIRTTITSHQDIGLVRLEHEIAGVGEVAVVLSLSPDLDAIDVTIGLGTLAGDFHEALGPGYGGAVRMVMDPGFTAALLADGPYAVERVQGFRGARRKYPSGDWMTSAQWFEDLEPAITSLSFLDVERGEDTGSASGLLVCQDSPMQWFRSGRALHAVIIARDPWDEERASTGVDFLRHLRITPHGPLDHASRVRLAAEAIADRQPLAVEESAKPVGGGTARGVRKDIPSTFGALEVSGAPGVLAHAFLRESMKSGEHLPDWAGHRMFAESGGACDHPFVIRLVEWNGEPACVVLKLPGEVARAVKTNLLGEVQAEGGPGPARGAGFSAGDTGWLEVIYPSEPPRWAHTARLRGERVPWSEVRFEMRPREIATVYADLVLGRKEWRDLDTKRKVWATVHKTRGKGGR